MTIGFGLFSIDANIVVQIGRGAEIAPRRLLERRDVGAGDERPAGPHDHDRGHRPVARGRLHSVEKRLRHTRAQRIDGRVTNLHNGHAAAER